MSILSYFTRRDFEDETARKKYGFTLAEILITLVIVGFIASLGIPMLGQQKMKKPNQVKMRHGTFECYYGQDGVLHSYYADSDENPNGVEDAHLSGGSCQFTPPSDSNVMIYAIGAGGTGAKDLSGIPYYVYKPFETSGWVSTGTDFQVSLAEACEEHPWVCENWDKQWDGNNAQEVEYRIYSPLGSGGKGARDKRLKHYAEGSREAEYCAHICAAWHPSCTDDCFDVVTADGGRGGKGSWYKIKVKLMSGDNVRFNATGTESSISFNANKFLTLQPSGSGTDGNVYNGNSYNGSSGQDHVLWPNTNWQNFMSWNSGNGTLGITSKGILDGNEPLSPDAITKRVTPGKIEVVAPTRIRYEAKESGINAYFGKAGTVGSTNLRVYEKLPSSIIFKLDPARTSSSGSEVKIIRNGSEESLFRASSGADGYVPQTLEHLPINKDDSVFPSKYKADSFLEQIPSFSASHGVGYRSKLAELQASDWFMPGKSGAGAYPVLYNVPQNNEPFKINGVVVTNGLVEAVHYELPETCFDGSALQNQGDQYYCGHGDNIGNPGAIVIKW